MRSILRRVALIVLASVWGFACNFGGPSYPPNAITGRDFPIGHIDSPFMMPDESAIYFPHSPVSTRGFLRWSVPWTTPASQPFPGHHGTRTLNWYNTDLYVSLRNPSGDYGRPENLGSAINSEHLECCPWVNEEQTVLIFSRDAFAHERSKTGTFVSRRPNKAAGG